MTGCVLVTGCSSGIGLETALAFGRAGHEVIAGVRRPESQSVVSAASQGLPVNPALLDVTDRASIDEVVSNAIARFGAIDVLVNNAGIGAMGSLEDTTEVIYRHVFETNVFGVMAMIQAVLPHMRSAGGGCIVNVGSIVGRVAVPFQPVYSATKHAVEALTDSLHYETSPFGIRMRVVEPGRIPTDFGSNLVSERAAVDSPYRQMHRHWEQGWSALPGREELASSVEVAAAILRAANPESPRHVPVGKDSVALIAKRDSLTAEAFETYLRTATGFVDEG